jgi:hypothetical protein
VPRRWLTDLLVVGAPSHRPGAALDDWLDDLLVIDAMPAALIDTWVAARADEGLPASMVIAERSRDHGDELAAPPQRFVVDDRSQPLPGEADAVTEWAARLAAQLV